MLMRVSRKYPPYSFFFSSRRLHTRSVRDWSSDVCSSDLNLSAFYTIRNDKEQLVLQQQMIDTRKEAFLFNTQTGIQHQNTEIEKLKAMIVNEDAIIERSEERRVGKECSYTELGCQMRGKV